MREVFELMEYLLDRSVHSVVNLTEAVKRGETEKLVESLRILQGDLMTMRQICAWMKSLLDEGKEFCFRFIKHALIAEISVDRDGKMNREGLMSDERRFDD